MLRVIDNDYILSCNVSLDALPSDMRQLRYDGISEDGIAYMRDLGGQTFDKAVDQLVSLKRR